MYGGGGREKLDKNVGFCGPSLRISILSKYRLPSRITSVKLLVGAYAAVKYPRYM